MDADELTSRAEREADEADVRVGRRVRALRLEKNLSLADLASRAGISIGALSQIERGMSSLRVRVIWPLAAALDVEPSALIADGNEPVNDLYCVRATSRRPLPVHSEGITKDLLSPPGASLTGMVVTVEPGGGTDAYAHSGHEFGIVTTGEAELVVDSTRYLLKTGDSFAFKSTLLHSFRNPGTERCTIVWVNTTKPSEARDGD
ncbi:MULTISPECIES: helix-turn-helix domain-containing protein [Rhizobium]|jgi:transcriptional regulator with XRE-family HTH domain|uniref:helix-turn-helix domain-containing protein n=1 Tax=Rhizobium TaxID=379 RepID=UPI0006458559|nr:MULTISPECIES: cupin domain-containing protein [Rhizobium]NKJ39987.1 transcriptional regulator with XRE-family HTH domain [Rhizobium sp. SG570]NRP87751.1 HTH-type transcriptional regulator PuuR [Ensifer adhaerens]NTJ09787.1 cupin domain-containing protein [Rhizobium lusitanum]